jgi:hypothetical protein
VFAAVVGIDWLLFMKVSNITNMRSFARIDERALVRLGFAIVALRQSGILETFGTRCAIFRSTATASLCEAHFANVAVLAPPSMRFSTLFSNA